MRHLCSDIVPYSFRGAVGAGKPATLYKQYWTSEFLAQI